MNGVQRYLAPTRLTQALAALAQPGGATVLAGGTDLMPQTHAGRVRPAPLLLNIRRVPGLTGVTRDGDMLVIGALTTIEDLRADDDVRQAAPLLAQVGPRTRARSCRTAWSRSRAS